MPVTSPCNVCNVGAGNPVRLPLRLGSDQHQFPPGWCECGQREIRAIGTLAADGLSQRAEALGERDWRLIETGVAQRVRALEAFPPASTEPGTW